MQDLDATVSDPNPAEEKALALSKAAILLDQARQHAAGSPQLSNALDQNVELWVGIQTVLCAETCSLSTAVRSNLSKLGDFVIGTTVHHGSAMGERLMDTLININLQVSEGLLETEVRSHSEPHARAA